ncbi:MAG: DUF4337 family protein [Opitutaceae bacterium]
MSTESTQQTNEENMRDAILEVRAFTKSVKDEKAKAEAKAKSEGWTKFAALSMALIALVAGYAMAKGGSCAGRVSKDLSEATYNETQAADQWSFYEAKSQKQMLLETELHLRDAMQDKNESRRASLESTIKRYDQEKTDIKAKADSFEAARNEFRKDAEIQTALGAKYGLAAQTFQIALAIGGLCLLAKKRWLWYVTLGVAALAIFRLVVALAS